MNWKVGEEVWYLSNWRRDDEDWEKRKIVKFLANGNFKLEGLTTQFGSNSKNDSYARGSSNARVLKVNAENDAIVEGRRRNKSLDNALYNIEVLAASLRRIGRNRQWSKFLDEELDWLARTALDLQTMKERFDAIAKGETDGR